MGFVKVPRADAGGIYGRGSRCWGRHSVLRRCASVFGPAPPRPPRDVHVPHTPLRASSSVPLWHCDILRRPALRGHWQITQQQVGRRARARQLRCVVARSLPACAFGIWHGMGIDYTDSCANTRHAQQHWRRKHGRELVQQMRVPQRPRGATAKTTPATRAGSRSSFPGALMTCSGCH